jgi:hypothetical protein
MKQLQEQAQELRATLRLWTSPSGRTPRQANGLIVEDEAEEG